MFKLKLQALHHPFLEQLDINDTENFRTLVVWLEDQKIRHYKINERGKLRDVASDNWPNEFATYLKTMQCPILDGTPFEQLAWLLSLATRVEYADFADKYSAVSVPVKPKNVPTVVNPLDNLKFDSPEFKNGVQTLAKLLNVSPHPNHLTTLKAVAKLVTKRLSKNALDNPNSVIVKGVPIPLEEANLGFDKHGDIVFKKAAKILRLLYIQDLRNLQTAINETIVSVQSITANPKTDTKLGKVGV